VIFFIMLGLGLFIGSTGYAYWWIMLQFSNTITRRTKEIYLNKILVQETAWFDSFNYNEMSARLTKEMMAINKAIGEKTGVINVAIGMTLCGLVIAFVNGWSLALAMVAIGPAIGVCAACFGAMTTGKFKAGLKAYG
jgi:ABC-type multidrug transport system fused ATPase/permease subunit